MNDGHRPISAFHKTTKEMPVDQSSERLSGKGSMTRRTKTNLVVDVTAFAAFVLLTATGLVERYMLPPGTGRFQSLWGMNRHQWGEIHFWIAMVLMAVLTTHVVLHWNWIVCMIRGRETEASAWRFAFGLVGLAGLIGLSTAPFLTTVEPTGERGRGRQQERRDGVTGEAEHSQAAEAIRGSMTLADVEEATGVSANVIIRELGLPPDIPRDENLGRLQREYGFELRQIRKCIEDHTAN